MEVYPQGFNTYDSLGEAYMISGITELAIQNYKKSLELNPENTGATEMLKRLENKSVAVDPKTYDAYAGEYEVTPTFMVRVFKEGEKLMTQATGQPPFELFPEAENRFFLRVENAKVTFNRDDKRFRHRSGHSPRWPRYAGKKDQMSSTEPEAVAIALNQPDHYVVTNLARRRSGWMKISMPHSFPMCLSSEQSIR